MYSCPNPPTNLEALLRDTCRRAMGLGLSFTDQLRLYRSIVALAREVRLRTGGVPLDAAGETLSTLLAAVSEHASALGLNPELPLPDALVLQRLAVQLSRTSRRVGATDRQFPAQNPMHRDKPPAPAFPKQAALQDEPPARPEARADIGTQHPLQRETEAPDGDSPHDDLDTPRPVDFRVKILNGDPERDAMSRRYRPDEDIEAAFAEARQRSAAMAAVGTERKRYA